MLHQLLPVRRGERALVRPGRGPTKFTTTLGLSGDARAKGFQELWATAYDQNVFIPLFGLNFVHGIVAEAEVGARHGRI